MKPVIPVRTIQHQILIVRGKRVLLDADLARFYQVGTRELNRALSRNASRFPADFAFKLTLRETQALMCQIGTSNAGRGGRRKPATVFTEQGIAMLASVLRSDRASAVSIAIIRAFVRLRELLAGNRQLAIKLKELERKVATHDGAIQQLFVTLRELLAPAPEEKREMGFHTHLLPPPAPKPKTSSPASARRPALNRAAPADR